MFKQKILLHSCCATCSAYILEKLSEKYIPTIFFYNPNIHPNEEYITRKNELFNYTQKINIPFIEGNYEPQKWFHLTKGLENEPEKGKRCALCFEIRLRETASYAIQNDFNIFSTTLTISPHKISNTIIEIGNSVAREYGITFLAEDFKKKDGYKKTMEIAKKENFYRQNYCGCLYSIRKPIK